VPSLSQRQRKIGAVQDGFPCSGGRDHDVGFMQVARKILQRKRIAADPRCQHLRMLERAIGDQQALGVLLQQMPCGELDGLAGADQQNAGLAQVTEDLLCKTHPGEGDRNRMRADLGVRADPLGDSKAMLEQPVEAGTQAAGVARQLPGVLDLAQDLRLAQHQRVEAGGYPEQVAHSVTVMVLIQAAPKNVELKPVGLGQPACGLALVAVADAAVDLGAIAGGNDRGLLHTCPCQQRGQRFGQALGRERHLLAQGDWRGLVAQAQRQQASLRTVGRGVRVHCGEMFRPGSPQPAAGAGHT
jgi:hypothetical protein